MGTWLPRSHKSNQFSKKADNGCSLCPSYESRNQRLAQHELRTEPMNIEFEVREVDDLAVACAVISNRDATLFAPQCDITE